MTTDDFNEALVGVRSSAIAPDGDAARDEAVMDGLREVTALVPLTWEQAAAVASAAPPARGKVSA